MAVEAARLAAKTSRHPEGPLGCLPWLGALQPPDGRATVWDPDLRRPVAAARAIWEATTGQPVPAGMSVHHVCDHPWCANSDHYVIGSAAANALQMVLRERSTVGRGPGGGRGSLSRLPADIRVTGSYRTAREIRERHRRMSQRGQATLFDLIG